MSRPSRYNNELGKEMRRMNRQEWIVIAIAAMILLAVYVFSFTSWGTGRGHPVVSKNRMAFSSAHSAILAYKLEYGAYPRSFQVLLSDGNEKKLSFLPDLQYLADSWGQEIRFAPTPDGFELRSAGPDKTFDTEDDIVKKEGNASEPEN